jgi:hypothetical protein
VEISRPGTLGVHDEGFGLGAVADDQLCFWGEFLCRDVSRSVHSRLVIRTSFGSISLRSGLPRIWAGRNHAKQVSDLSLLPWNERPDRRTS